MLLSSRAPALRWQSNWKSRDKWGRVHRGQIGISLGTILLVKVFEINCGDTLEGVIHIQYLIQSHIRFDALFLDRHGA